MSMWDFKRESNVDIAGANTEAGYIAGYQPFAEADALPSKRNVVATDKGWVRRQVYTDTHGNVRTKDEVLVAAHPGGDTNGGYSNTDHLGTADIGIMQLGANTVTGISTYANGVAMTVSITWNEPLAIAGTVDVVATRRDGANTFTLTANTTAWAEYVGNNTLVFTGTPTAAGEYKVRAQTLTVSGDLISTNFDGESANVVVSAAVSNTLMNVAGSVLSNGEFTVV